MAHASARKSIVKRRSTLVAKKAAAKRPQRPLTHKVTQGYEDTRRPASQLPSAWKLFRCTVGLVRAYPLVIMPIIVIYLLLSVALIQNLAASLDLKGLQSAFSAGDDRLNRASVAVQWIAGGGSFNDPTGSTNQADGVYYVMLLLMTSLAMIYALRHSVIGTRIRVRDAYYKGMYPVIPLILILLLGVLQTVPALTGLVLYVGVVSLGLAGTLLLQFVWLLPALALVLWSAVMLASTLMAACIVALPDMTPLRALRSAKQLVAHRRMVIVRKYSILGLLLIGILAAVSIPCLLFVPVVMPVVAYLYGAVALYCFISFTYVLYRELLI